MQQQLFWYGSGALRECLWQVAGHAAATCTLPTWTDLALLDRPCRDGRRPCQAAGSLLLPVWPPHSHVEKEV